MSKEEYDKFIMVKCPSCPNEWIVYNSFCSEGTTTVFCSQCGGIFELTVTLNIKIKKRR